MQAKAAEKGRSRKAAAPEEIKKAKKTAEGETPAEDAPKKKIEREIWETDLDKPRAPRKPRRYGDTDRPKGGHRDKGAR